MPGDNVPGVAAINNIASETICQAKCNEIDGCNFFNYATLHKLCAPKTKANQANLNPLADHFSGPKICPDRGKFYVDIQ